MWHEHGWVGQRRADLRVNGSGSCIWSTGCDVSLWRDVRSVERRCSRSEMIDSCCIMRRCSNMSLSRCVLTRRSEVSLKLINSCVRRVSNNVSLKIVDSCMWRRCDDVNLGLVGSCIGLRCNVVGGLVISHNARR